MKPELSDVIHENWLISCFCSSKKSLGSYTKTNLLMDGIKYDHIELFKIAKSVRLLDTLIVYARQMKRYQILYLISRRIYYDSPSTFAILCDDAEYVSEFVQKHPEMTVPMIALAKQNVSMNIVAWFNLNWDITTYGPFDELCRGLSDTGISLKKPRGYKNLNSSEL